MSWNPRWWRISFRITIILIAVVAATFSWAAFSPMSTEHDEWTKLGVAIVSALTGFLLVAIVIVLWVVRFLRRRAESPRP